MERQFCPTCGSPLFSRLQSQPDIVVVKVGSLDDPSAFKVGLDLWMASAQPWHRPHEGVPGIPQGPGRLMARYDFASDNVAGAMPEVMEALARHNGGAHPSYGDGEVCARAADLIRSLLDVDAEVWFAASGTAANALCLGALAQPHEAVLAHEVSHVATDETGAPGFFGSGLGITTLPGASGRIDPAALGRRPRQARPAALAVARGPLAHPVHRAWRPLQRGGRCRR